MTTINMLSNLNGHGSHHINRMRNVNAITKERQIECSSLKSSLDSSIGSHLKSADSDSKPLTRRHQRIYIYMRLITPSSISACKVHEFDRHERGQLFTSSTVLNMSVLTKAVSGLPLLSSKTGGGSRGNKF